MIPSSIVAGGRVSLRMLAAARHLVAHTWLTTVTQASGDARSHVGRIQERCDVQSNSPKREYVERSPGIGAVHIDCQTGSQSGQPGQSQAARRQIERVVVVFEDG